LGARRDRLGISGSPIICSKGHLGSGGWLATGVPSVITSEPANEAAPRTYRCQFRQVPFSLLLSRLARPRPAGGRRMLLVFPSQRGSCFGFQRVAGAKPPWGAGGFTPTDSSTNSPDEPVFLSRNGLKRDRSAPGRRRPTGGGTTASSYSGGRSGPIALTHKFCHRA
jgi:hypothetical protein